MPWNENIARGQFPGRAHQTGGNNLERTAVICKVYHDFHVSQRMFKQIGRAHV